MSDDDLHIFDPFEPEKPTEQDKTHLWLGLFLVSLSGILIACFAMFLIALGVKL